MIVQHKGSGLQTRRAAAIRLAVNHGFKVFAVQRDKTPFLGTNGHLDATDDPAAIAEMFDAHPEANVAIACDASGLVCIDVDPRNGGTETWKALKAKLGNLPRTIWQRTPSGGFHLVYRAPSGVKLKGTAGPGVDLKFHGYIVVAPSQNGAGPYRWVVSPDEQEPAELPPEWIEEFTALEPASSLPREYVRIPTGARDTTLSQHAGRLRRHGYIGSELFDMLQAINLSRCEEPLDERDVRRIAESYSRRDGGEFEIVEPPADTREVAVLRRENADLKREVKQQAEIIATQRAALDDRNEQIAAYKSDLGAYADVLLEVAREVESRVQKGATDADGFVHLRFGAVATRRVGKNVPDEVREAVKSRTTRALAKAEERGLLEKRTITELSTVDEETGEILDVPKRTRMTYVRWARDYQTMRFSLANCKRPESAPKRGGWRPRCEEHPDAQVIRTYSCSICNKTLVPPASIVPDPEDDAEYTEPHTHVVNANLQIIPIEKVARSVNASLQEPVHTVFIEEANELIALAKQAEASGDKAAAEELWAQAGRLL